MDEFKCQMYLHGYRCWRKNSSTHSEALVLHLSQMGVSHWITIPLRFTAHRILKFYVKACFAVGKRIIGRRWCLG